MKKIHILALIPVLCLVVGPIFANSVTPYVLGMPFYYFGYYYQCLLHLLYGACVRV